MQEQINCHFKKIQLPLWSSYGLFSAPQIITSRSLLPAVSSPLTESEGKLPKRALEEREEEEGGKMDQTRRAYVRVKRGGNKFEMNSSNDFLSDFFIVLFARSTSANFAFSLFELIVRRFVYYIFLYVHLHSRTALA